MSNDPVLQTRVLAYADTQRYRLGVNYQLLPVSFAPGISVGALLMQHLYLYSWVLMTQHWHRG